MDKWNDAGGAWHRYSAPDSSLIEPRLRTTPPAPSPSPATPVAGGQTVRQQYIGRGGSVAGRDERLRLKQGEAGSAAAEVVARVVAMVARVVAMVARVARAGPHL